MREDKILGCLLGAATGDAMGAATEAKSTGQIKEIFGGRVEDFQTPPKDVQARGRKAGQVTDAFSIPYYLAEEIIKNQGAMTKEAGIQALLKWGESEYYEPFAGMTTRKVIHRLNEQKKLNTWDHIGHLGNKLFVGHYYALSSNGAAVKAYPIGVLSNGDVEKAIADAAEITTASHDDPYSISGACAVAAAVSEAMKENATVYSVVKAAQYGAEKGEAIARTRNDIHVYPGPSVWKRLEMAISIALQHGEEKDGELSQIMELRDCIGSGPAIAETVPTALGIIIAHQGDTMKSIYSAVNIGDETSAIASIVGAICGTLNGSSSVTEGYLDIIDECNGMNLKNQAQRLGELCQNY